MFVIAFLFVRVLCDCFKSRRRLEAEILVVPSENFIRLGVASKGRIIASFWAMFAILHALGMFFADIFKSWSRLEAENLFLRHQLNIALRRAPPRLRLHG